MNTIGVLMACLGLAAAVWGATGSVRWSAGAAGLVLFVAAGLLLIDVGDQ